MTRAAHRIQRLSPILLLLLGLSFLSGTVRASQSITPHPHSDIIHQARQFLEQGIDTNRYKRSKITMGHLDSRLSLRKCEVPLQTELAPGRNFSGKTTVHVKCRDQSPWTVYVNAQIQLFGLAAYTARPLPRGHILDRDDLVLQETDLGQLHYGHYQTLEPLIGQQLKRRLPGQRLLKVNYVKPPTLVKRGEIVTIVAENTGFSVKMSGKALMNGARGDRIRVRNLSSKRVIEGTVTQPGTVEIN